MIDIPEFQAGTRVRGSLDYCDGREIRGWAMYTDSETPPTVIVTIDGVERARVVPNILREDLHLLGIDLAAAFVHTFRPPLDGDCVVELWVDGVRLANTPWRHAHCHRPVKQLFRGVRSLRAAMARRFLNGDGIEIEPGRPVDLPPQARATRVLCTGSPTPAQGVEFVHDDCEQLPSFADNSLDFICACRFLERAEDPIGCLKAWSRVLRNDGVVLLSAAGRNAGAGARMPLVRMEHLRRDHELGPKQSRRSHYLQWAAFGHDKTGPDAWELSARLEREGSLEWVHTWTLPGFMRFLHTAITEYGLPLFVEIGVSVRGESVYVLRKLHGTAASRCARGPRGQVYRTAVWVLRRLPWDLYGFLRRRMRKENDG